MYDRDDDELPPVPDAERDPVKELKTVAFLLNGLYKQLADERDTITMAAGQMTHAAKQFQGYLAQFEVFDKTLKKHTVETIYKMAHQAVQEVASQIGETVAKAATVQVEAITKSLGETATRAERQLIGYHYEQKQFELWRWLGFTVIALCSGLIGALATDYFFPAQTFTKAQWEQMDYGKTLMNAWNKLNDHERERIEKLGK